MLPARGDRLDGCIDPCRGERISCEVHLTVATGIFHNARHPHRCAFDSAAHNTDNESNRLSQSQCFRLLPYYLPINESECAEYQLIKVSKQAPRRNFRFKISYLRLTILAGNSFKESDSILNPNLKSEIPWLVLEMTNAGKHHRQVMFIRGNNNFLVTYRATWLNDRGDAVLRRFINAIAKREESVRSQHRACERKLRSHCANFYRIDARHLTSTYADSLIFPSVDDC